MRLLLILPLAAAALSACSWFSSDVKNPFAEAPLLVGRIASVSADQKFVLVESYGAWNVPAGTPLVVHGPNGRNANLLATGETLRRHAAADIQSGALGIGDGVYTLPASMRPKQTDDTAPDPGKTSQPVTPPTDSAHSGSPSAGSP